MTSPREMIFSPNSQRKQRYEQFSTSPMISGSPSHVSEPIQIQIPRRRLFCTTSPEESRDSGFDSPSHHYMRRSTFQESSSVIYEDIEDELQSLISDNVFTFDDDKQSRPSNLLILASPAAHSPMINAQQHNSPMVNAQSHHSPMRNSQTLHSPMAYCSRRDERRFSMRLLSSSVPTVEHQLLMSPYRSSPGSSNNSHYHPVVHEGGRSRSRSDPSAPPLNLYEEIEGYELTRDFSSVFMLAPSCYQANEAPPPYEQFDQQSPTQEKRYITEQDAVDALSKFLANNCCYGNTAKKIDQQIRAKEIRPGNEHQYMLETFYEERKTIWFQEPYTAQLIDGPENGPPPKAWDIVVSKPDMFRNKDVSLEVPHTASVKDCNYCHGKGSKHCTLCHGKGDVRCTICDGHGIIHHFSPDDLIHDRTTSSNLNRACHHCNNGRKKCKQCDGSGWKVCSTCQGHGRMKVYIRLTVKWKVLKSAKSLECSRLPKKCIAQVSGNLVFQEENDRVYPLIDFPEKEINEHSRSLVTNHAEQVKHALIVMQRHCVREIPVAEVRCEWKRKDFTYWVYGNENRVYCPDNPVKCYGNCSIL